MPISIGSKAPEFTLKRKAPEGLIDVRLSDNFGKKATVLLFFPAAFSSVCTDEMCGVANGQFLDADESTAVFGISVDGFFAQEAWAKSNAISVPLLSDFGRKVVHDYDVVIPDFGGTGGEAAARAAFVIDKEGIVRYAEQTPEPKILPNFDAIRELLSRLGA